MIESISKWAGSIAVAVIIVTILEMILPDGKNKKYIKTVMGIYILFTIISPIIKMWDGKDIDIQSMANITTSKVYTNSIDVNTSASIESIYLSNIKKDISLKIEQRGYIVKDVDLKIETKNEETYGTIYEMEIGLTKTIEEKQKNNTSTIPKIEINIGNTGLKKELSSTKTINQKDKDDLKEFLSSTYSVSKENITIREVD